MHKSAQLDASVVRGMIQHALATERSGLLLHRLDCVLMVAQGRSCSEVANWIGVDRRTIERWVHAAYLSGMAGLVEVHAGGRPATFTSAQMEGVWPVLQASPGAFGYPESRWTGKRLARHLAMHLGIAMSVRTCQRLIAQQGAGKARAR